MTVWTPTDEALKAALDHADAVWPFEMCGVVADGCFRAMRNTAERRMCSFRLDMEAYNRIARKHLIEAIVHSHPPAYPMFASDGDRAMIDALRMPWMIIRPLERRHVVLYPSNGRAPLIGRDEVASRTLIADAVFEYCGVKEPFEIVEVSDNWQHCDIAILSDGRAGIIMSPGEILHCPRGGFSRRDKWERSLGKDAKHFRLREFT